MLRFLLFVILLAAPVFGQEVSFISESITIEPAEDECILSGVYYFENSGSSPLRTTFYYPFIISDDLPYPHKIKVTRLFSPDTLKYKRSAKGIHIFLELPEWSSTGFRVEYRQRPRTNEFRYILTTTGNWGKPFAEAEYYIKLPETYDLKYSSIKPDSVTQTAGYSVYSSYRSSFMPKEDFIVRWEE